MSDLRRERDKTRIRGISNNVVLSNSNSYSTSTKHSGEKDDRSHRKRTNEDRREVSSTSERSTNIHAKVYVGNVPTERLSDTELLDFFKPFGQVADIRVYKGYIFVQYDREEDARKLIKEGQNTLTLKGNKLDVLPAMDASSDPSNTLTEKDSHPQTSQSKQQKNTSGTVATTTTTSLSSTQTQPSTSESYTNRDYERQERIPIGSSRYKEIRDYSPRRSISSRDRDNIGLASSSSTSTVPRHSTSREASTHQHHHSTRYSYNEEPARKRVARANGEQHYVNEQLVCSDTEDERRYSSSTSSAISSSIPSRDPYVFRRTPATDQRPLVTLLSGPPTDSNQLVDCEIIIVNPHQRDYADEIESRLRTHGMVTSILLLREDYSLTQAVDSSAKRQCLFAVIAMPLHEQKRTASFHILYGQTEEHRNLSLEDGYHILLTNFIEYQEMLRKRATSTTDQSATYNYPQVHAHHPPIMLRRTPSPVHANHHHNQEVDTYPHQHSTRIVHQPLSSTLDPLHINAPPIVGDKLPLPMLLCLLAERRQLTLEEIDRVLVYLLEKKSEMLGLPCGTLPPLPAQYAQSKVTAASAAAAMSSTGQLSSSTITIPSSIIPTNQNQNSSTTNTSTTAVTPSTDTLTQTISLDIAAQIRQILSSTMQGVGLVTSDQQLKPTSAVVEETKMPVINEQLTSVIKKDPEPVEKKEKTPPPIQFQTSTPVTDTYNKHQQQSRSFSYNNLNTNQNSRKTNQNQNLKSQRGVHIGNSTNNNNNGLIQQNVNPFTSPNENIKQAAAEYVQNQQNQQNQQKQVLQAQAQAIKQRQLQQQTKGLSAINSVPTFQSSNWNQTQQSRPMQQQQQPTASTATFSYNTNSNNTNANTNNLMKPKSDNSATAPPFHYPAESATFSDQNYSNFPNQYASFVTEQKPPLPPPQEQQPPPPPPQQHPANNIVVVPNTPTYIMNTGPGLLQMPSHQSTTQYLTTTTPNYTVVTNTTNVNNRSLQQRQQQQSSSQTNYLPPNYVTNTAVDATALYQQYTQYVQQGTTPIQQTMIRKYTWRIRFCGCIPIILCELFLPVVLLGVVFVVQYFLGNNENVVDVTKSVRKRRQNIGEILGNIPDQVKCPITIDDNKKLLNPQWSDRCLLFPKIYDRDTPSIYPDGEMLNDQFIPTQLYIDGLYGQVLKSFLNGMKEFLTEHQCLNTSMHVRTVKTILQPSNKIPISEKQTAFLLNNKFGNRIIVEFKNFDKYNIEYNIIVRAPRNTTVRKDGKFRLNHEFLYSLHTPSEIHDSQKEQFAKFSNIKMAVDIVAARYFSHKPKLNLKIQRKSLTCTKYKSEQNVFDRVPLRVNQVFLNMIFLFSYFILANSIIKERNQKVKEILKIINIPPLLNNFAWSLRTLIIMLLVTMGLTCLWKIPINKTYGSLFSNVSLIYIILTFVFLSIQITSYAIFFAQLFNSFTTTFIFSIIIFIIMMTLGYIGSHLPVLLSYLLCMNPFYSTIFILTHQYLFERAYVNITLFKPLYKQAPRIGLCWLSIIMSIGFYWFLVWYVEKIMPGDFGIPLPWNFIFTREYWEAVDENVLFRQSQLSLSTHDSEHSLNDSSSAIVEIKNLVKNFGLERNAVDDVTFSLFTNEITGLLGHNGAGKTTIMNMLIGIFSQTSGTIKVLDKDTKFHMDYIRQFMSYCPQHDILFDLLTVQEQVEFHAIARGYEANKDAICTNLLQMVSLLKDRHVYCQDLSGGMKRRLSIACAFIGDTKIVLLGLDPSNRRLLWNWIRSVRENRTILLTTHFMEEADALSDRIIIMVDGKIKADGSSIELKTQFGSGYKFTIAKIVELNINIYDTILHYLPHAEIELESKDEIVIRVNVSPNQNFINCLKQLEFMKYYEQIANYGVSNTTLDEVFLKIAVDKVESNTSTNQDTIRDVDIKENCFEVFDQRTIEDGYDYYISQYEGLIIKSVQICSRRWFLALILIILPIGNRFFIRTEVTTNIESFDMNYEYFYPQKIYIQSTSQTLLDNMINTIGNKYTIVDHHVQSIHNIDELIHNLRIRDPYTYSTVHFGFFMDKPNEIEYVNSHLTLGYEALNIAMNILYKEAIEDHNSGILIKSKLLYRINPNDQMMEANFLNFIQIYGRFCLSIANPPELLILELLSYYLIFFYISVFVISEKKDHFLHLLHIFGLHPLMYWSSRYLVDLLICGIFILINWSVYEGYNHLYLGEEKSHTIQKQNEVILYRKYYQLVIVICINILPFVYLLSKLFKSDLLGGLFIYLIIVLTECFEFARAMLQIVGLLSEGKKRISYWLTTVLCPNLNSKRLISYMLKEFRMSPDSKPNMKPEYSDMRYYAHFFVLLMQVGGILLLLVLIDTGMIKQAINNMSLMPNVQCVLFFIPFDEANLDEDVLDERKKILTNEDDTDDDPLVVKDVVKQYPTKVVLAVNHVAFSAKQNECFGLLGFNGAGKTSLFKIIIGEELPTEGGIYIDGEKMHELIKGGSKEVGYCPQFDCTIDFLTVEDFLTLFARIRGITGDRVEIVVKSVAKLFMLEKFYKQYADQLSGGTKRRLHACLACIGPPLVILLDEPTTGVDPYSRRQMRQVFQYATQTDVTIILTSHSMEECEILCNRLGIMVKGQLQCLGNIQHLKAKFGKGYTIDVKLKVDKDNDDDQRLEDLYNYLNSNVPIELLHQTNNTGLFQSESSPALLFHLIEHAKAQYDIETYAVQQTTLEQIFLSFEERNLNDVIRPHANVSRSSRT
ncbi:unnamed protein product [Didymodactylos carnosus]|uniref:Uncharacterized protein n=1 Tax=Didymodactylos carnosus TaxID=1234261 RepID=A0A8S2GL24_9BILA|nr:unnamed protein product [Didymodactylos carnosus]CAF3530385.1 unnamed protein product [Didymodactylos carnosus]